MKKYSIFNLVWMLSRLNQTMRACFKQFQYEETRNDVQRVLAGMAAAEDVAT